jgi:ATP-binding cassette subfamily B protein
VASDRAGHSHVPQTPAIATDPPDARAATWPIVGRLIRLGLRHRGLLLLALVITVVMQLMAVGEYVSAGLAVDVLRHWVDPAAPAPRWPFGLLPPESDSLIAPLSFAAGAALGFGLLSAGGFFAARMANELLAQAIVVNLRDEVYRALQRLPFSFYDTHDSGTIINRVTADVQSVRDFIQGVLIRAFTSLATLVVFLAAMIAIHPWLTLACLSFVVLQGVVMLSWGRKARPAFKVLREVIDNLISRLSEGVQGIRVVKSFGREDAQSAAFNAQSELARDKRQGIWRMMGNHMPLIQGSAFLGMAVLVGYGGYLVHLGPAQGGVALGAIWVFFGLMRTLAGQLEQISGVAAQLPEALTGAERVFDILDRTPSIRSPDRPRVNMTEPIRGGIEFRNVSFWYESAQPGRDKPTAVLRDVSFAVRAGETVAIVGPTGAGKSTLLQLIPRFHDATQGEVLIDGVNVREHDLPRLRRAIGFVFQEPYLFSNTIRANAAFGRPDAPIEAVRRAADTAAATAFINALPDGFDTVIGERGVTLSGGERQRLSIARATLIEPAILILDDATSAVDAVTEARIRAALSAEGVRRTTILVAHRLSTLRRADRVIVIEDGRVAAQGTHDELMRTDSHYRDAAFVQFEDDSAELDRALAAAEDAVAFDQGGAA